MMLLHVFASRNQKTHFFYQKPKHITNNLKKNQKSKNNPNIFKVDIVEACGMDPGTWAQFGLGPGLYPTITGSEARTVGVASKKMHKATRL